MLYNGDSYEDAVKGAVAFGNDTDTTAAIAGGLAGILLGQIPDRWMDRLQARQKVERLLELLEFQRNETVE